MNDPVDPVGLPDEIGRELREGADHVFRIEAEAAEADARIMAARSRTLGHVAYDKMVRGDHIAVHAGDVVLSGPIVHARADLAVVALRSGATALVNLAGPVVIRSLDARSGGTTWDRAGATSFLAALRELDIARSAVRLHVSSVAAPIAGVVEAVTPDHIAVAASETHHVPLGSISAVVVDEPERISTRGMSSAGSNPKI